MKVIGINSSPRKDWNDDILIHTALEGAASEGTETEAINLSGLHKPKEGIGCHFPYQTTLVRKVWNLGL